MAEQGRIWSESELSVLFDVYGDDPIQRQNPKCFFSADTQQMCDATSNSENVRCSYCDVIN